MADLLTLDFTSIAGNEPRIAKRLAQGFVVLDQCARNAMTDCAGLTGDSAAIHADADVELVHELHGFERLTHDHAAGFAAEELIERAIIHSDRALAGAQIDTGGSGLAPAGAVI